MGVMSRDEWLSFLQESARPGVLATTGSDGRPHAVPVWFDLDDGVVVFNTGRETVKGRNVRREGRATLCVQDDRPPYSFVMISGPTRWSEDLTEVRRWATRIGGRYMGDDRAIEFGERNGVPGELVVWLVPERVVAHGAVAD